MGHIGRNFRLTNEAGGLGLSCTSEGLSLAGVPLLHKTDAGFAPRSPSDLNALFKAAYGEDADSLEGSLNVVANDLSRGETARAMIAAVLMRLPELDWEAAARLARADERLAKYDPDQPRDEQGRWTDEGGADASEVGASDADDIDPPQSPLEQKYDNLSPVDFAKEVIQFGDRLGREGANLTPEQRAAAQEEYAFLQNRLSFWLNYDYKPGNAQANLLSAAQTLYEGAVVSGVAAVGGPHGDLPQSMVAVGAGLIGMDGSQPGNVFRRPLPGGAPIGDERFVPVEGKWRVRRPGEVVDNDTETRVRWSQGIDEQGSPMERFIDEEHPGSEKLEPTSDTFDHYRPTPREAISTKTLDTVTASRIRNPQLIYGQLKGYVDRVADYDGGQRRSIDLDPSIIDSKTIQLGIPEGTSPVQWKYIDRAIRYANNRNVSMVVTRIR